MNYEIHYNREGNRKFLVIGNPRTLEFDSIDEINNYFNENPEKSEKYDNNIRCWNAGEKEMRDIRNGKGF